MRSDLVLFALVLAALPVYAFSIDSYHSDVTVLDDGDLQVHESINFTLDEAYNEGFRSIRNEDFSSLSDIRVELVEVNGAPVEYALQMNGDQAEIVWKKTFVGTNDVELAYTINDRAQPYNDFAKVCFEHYGAGWPVPAARFSSRMTMPEAARGKDMHFEIYSYQEGDARVDDLSVVVEMQDVQPGNYVGGCYLYDKGALHSNNTVNASAIQILKDERQAYGSKTILEEEDPGSTALCCMPIAIISALVAGYFFVRDLGIKRLPENILPPDDKEPAVVSALVRNRVKDSEVLAAAILAMINRGDIDIVELEKKDEKSAGVKREHTILILKRTPKSPKPYEAAVLDMLFGDGQSEVDLDQMAADYDKISGKAEAGSLPVAKHVKTFKDEINKVLEEGGVSDVKDLAGSKDAMIVSFGFFGLVVFCGMLFWIVDAISVYSATGNQLEIIGTITAIVLFFISVLYIAMHHRRPTVPDALRGEYSLWDAFARAVKASRLKEYPPASAIIWGEILVYATALGLADKVKAHMSELDALTRGRLESLERAGVSSTRYFASAWALHNLGSYGSRSGPQSGGHGGFSSHSSGGWSSGGGGGFSSGSSGGGGFR
ncbi:MAG: DUF2207 domain-containing protein [Candidatus Micrarchaeota archaeon]